MEIIKLEKSRNKVVFDVTAEDFKVALDKAFEVKNAKVSIKGFRAGKAPRHVYEKNFGVESLYEEALNFVLNAKAEEVYKNEELAKKIVGKFEPEIESENGIDPEGFKISLTFDVYPEVSLPQYKGIEVKAADTNVSEEEVNKAIEVLMTKDASMEAKAEQVIAKGDYAVFDFLGKVDGVAFDGGKAENYELEIGSGQFIPGFEDQMIGMKAEETKDVVVTFPENYGAKDLAGKEAVFTVTVHEVKVKSFPELTDEYVAGLSIEGVSTVAELKANKEAELKANKEQTEKDRIVDEIINKVLDNTVIDMPESLIAERVNGFKAQYENQAKMYNIPFETFLSLMGTTVEKFEEEAYKFGSRQALFNVVAGEIIEVEKLAPSKEQLEAKAEAEAAKNGQNKEELLRKNISAYYSQLAYEALIDLLVSNAKLV